MLSDDLARHVHPLTRFDGLALEAGDPPAQATFWRTALGGRLSDAGDGHLRIDPGPGRPAREIMRVEPAGTPAGGSSRVHVDLRLAGPRPDDLVAAGARVVRTPGTDPWYVLSDPEGNEFCAYPAVDDRPAGVFQLVVKCHDAHGLARWWGRVLGGRVEHEGESAVVIGAPEFPWDYLVFDPVPEPPTGRGTLRWHVALRDSDPSELLHRGASTRREPGRHHDGWILADPEGNEFHAHRPPTG